MGQGLLVTVTPNPSLDRFCSPGTLELGRLNRLGEVTTRAGGKGINVARAANAAGCGCRIISTAGGAGGAALGKLLERERLAYEFVPVAGETRINLKVSCGGVFTEFNEAGPRADSSTADRLCEALERCLGNGRERDGAMCAAFCGSLPPGFPPDGYARLIHTARACGAYTVLDADGEALRRGLEAVPDLIKPNADELAGLFGELGAPPERLRELARVAVERGMARAVLCSLGAGGAFYLSRELYVHEAALPVRGIATTVGAGDALLGGFLSARLHKASRQDALRTGVRAAANQIEQK